jgi:hypothetical protein
MAQFGFARSGLASLAFVAALATTAVSWPLQAQQTSDAAAPTLVPLPPGAADMGPTPGYSQTPTGGAPAPAPMAEPSPLIGKQPPLPLSLPQWRRLRGNPEALSQMQSSLPPVSLTPAPEPPVAGAWQLGPQPPGTPPLSNPLLLTDGSVIAHVSCTGTWWRLTPDNSGSYLYGTWSQIASLPSGYTPRFFSSAVLPDGRVIVEGGEYNTNCAAQWTNLGAIYNPNSNTWTSVSPPSGMTNIGDAQATVLANGTYMQGDSIQRLAALLNPNTLTWTATGSGKFDSYDEEGWTLLPDNTVLTVDAYVSTGTCGMNTERYSSGTGAWVTAGATPTHLADCSNPGNSLSFEMGPQVLRPDGTVVAFGGTLCSDAANASCGNGALSVITPTAIYNTGNKLWAPGPNLPTVGGRHYTLADAPAALLPSGNVLFAASPNYQGFVNPTHFFEMDGQTNGIVQVSDPTDAASFTSFQWNFVILPNGQILALETDGSNVWLYNPAGAPSAAWKPGISSAPGTVAPGMSYEISGTQFNGLSQGSAYGDDQQSATSYPLVTIQNAGSGHIAYARTFDHNTMSVAPGTSGGTNFTVPAGIERGTSYLWVTANGISSKPVTVETGPLCCGNFNGDGFADIFWRNLDGSLFEWWMDGANVIGGGFVDGNLSSYWFLAGFGDFNGDGKTDVLWRNSDTSQVMMWLMNGTSIASQSVIFTVNPGWQIAAIADFNGDGKADILWRNIVTGDTFIYLMDGFNVIGSSSLGIVTLDWQFVGVGDFNGDGKADILWRNSNGQVVEWFMNGLSVIGSGSQGVVSLDWQIAGVGDFNGDGRADILWRNSDGQVVEWFMNGANIIGSGSQGVVSADWQIAGVGDINGDGKADILWRNTNGQVVEWFMNGANIIGSGSQGIVSADWQIE